MNEEVIVALKQELETGEGLSSYGAIVEWLEKEHGLSMEYGTVYAWVRYRFGAKLKAPRPKNHKLSGRSSARL
jgi:transposase